MIYIGGSGTLDKSSIYSL